MGQIATAHFGTPGELVPQEEVHLRTGAQVDQLALDVPVLQLRDEDSMVLVSSRHRNECGNALLGKVSTVMEGTRPGFDRQAAVFVNVLQQSNEETRRDVTTGAGHKCSPRSSWKKSGSSSRKIGRMSKCIGVMYFMLSRACARTTLRLLAPRVRPSLSGSSQGCVNGTLATVAHTHNTFFLACGSSRKTV